MEGEKEKSRLRNIQYLTEETNDTLYGKVFVISDLHLGFNTSWNISYKNLLLNFLSSLPEYSILVLNGDIFEQWKFDLQEKNPKGVTNLRNLYYNVEYVRDFINKVNELHEMHVKVYYVRGNHDCFVKGDEVEELMPEVQFVAKKLRIKFHNQYISFSHGHEYDLFNADEVALQNDKGMNIGYYACRLACQFGGYNDRKDVFTRTIDKQHKAIKKPLVKFLKDKKSLKNFLLKPLFVAASGPPPQESSSGGGILGVFKSVVNCVGKGLQYAKNMIWGKKWKKIKNLKIVEPDGDIRTIGEVVKSFDYIIKRVSGDDCTLFDYSLNSGEKYQVNYKDIDEMIVAVGSCGRFDHFVAKFHKNDDIVVFGHTHTPYEDGTKTCNYGNHQMMVNSGCWLEDGRSSVVEIECDSKQQLYVRSYDYVWKETRDIPNDAQGFHTGVLSFGKCPVGKCSASCDSGHKGDCNIPCHRREVCCRGHPKIYSCCGMPFGTPYCPNQLRALQKVHKNEGFLDGCCPGRRSGNNCDWRCYGHHKRKRNDGKFSSVPCNNRGMCCKGFKKRYKCCRKLFGEPGCKPRFPPKRKLVMDRVSRKKQKIE